MNRCSIIIFVLAAFPLLQAEKYTSKWDNIDIDEILSSDRLLENYKKCLMNQGKCTPEGTELKKRLPDALTTDCSKCTEKQKINTEKVVNCLIETKKEWWAELQQKYDPSGIYYNRVCALQLDNCYVVNNEDSQELLGSHNQKLAIDELIGQDIEELEYLDQKTE